MDVDPDGTRADLRDKWRAEGWYSTLTVGAAIQHAVSSRAELEVVFATKDGQTCLTLGELGERARRVAGGLVDAGVRPGAPVVVSTPDLIEGTTAAIAVWLAGAVLVPVVPFATASELDGLIRRSGAIAVIRGGDVLELDVGRPRGPVSVAPAAVACVIFTSGSTAEPKGVMHSHETLLCGILETADTVSKNVTLSTFPPGHVASALGLVRTMTSGGRTVMMSRWSPALAAALIEEHGVTSGAGTPFYLSTLLDEAERSGRDITSLQTFLVGAASVPPALIERAQLAGIVAWRTYGSTEHPSISSGSPADPAAHRTYTDGKVAPGNELRIVAEDGTTLPPGEEGEILARGPKQFLGYLDPALDVEAFSGTWFRTGDIGRLSADGDLVVTDRKKDVIIRGGENISAREVEDALATHPSVAEVAVVAGPDDTWGEVVVAYVSLRPGTTMAREAAQDHVLAAGLAPHKAPLRLHLVDDFPRTAAGKIRKADLRAALRSDHS